MNWSRRKRMPRMFVIFAAIVLPSFFLQIFAQNPEFRPVNDLSAFKKKFTTESAKVQSITSDFIQEKTLAALTEKITSTGRFWFKRNNRVRIEYQKPFTYLMIMNGDKMSVRDNEKENTIEVKSNRLFRQVNRIMIDCVQGTILDSKDFTSKVFENDHLYLLEMTPTAKSLREFFQTILLIVEKKDYSVKSIEMNEPAGDKTIISFKNKRLNEQVADTVFAL